ncbi:hypothetical protein ACFLXH_02140 [Chloroflexota bacterium]
MPTTNSETGRNTDGFSEKELEIIHLMAKGSRYDDLKEKLAIDSDNLIHILGSIIRKRSESIPDEKPQ